MRTNEIKWEFKARFRPHALGWKSQPAITRVKQAVAEIRKVARKEPLVAAEGAVTFLERVLPALEQVDSSSGAIGTAVGNSMTELVPMIANAPTDEETRSAWLARLYRRMQIRTCGAVGEGSGGPKAVAPVPRLVRWWASSDRAAGRKPYIRLQT